MNATIAARIGRPDLMSPVSQATGTYADAASPVASSQSSDGRPGLILLAGAVLALMGFSYWTR